MVLNKSKYDEALGLDDTITPTPLENIDTSIYNEIYGFLNLIVLFSMDP